MQTSSIALAAEQHLQRTALRAAADAERSTTEV
jgi:hypothetical protein